MGGGGDWKFHSYKGTNLCYDMMCESVNSDQEEKDLINGRKKLRYDKVTSNRENGNTSKLPRILG